MDRLFNKLSDSIYRHLRLFWFLVTLVVLVIGSYITWHSNLRNAYKDLTEIATRVAKDLDTSIDGAFADVQYLPTKENMDCRDDIFPYLYHIIINHPQISGLAVQNVATQSICSTLPNNKSFLLTEQESTQGMSGPFNISMFEYPFYSIKRNIGEFNIELVFVSPVLESILRIPGDAIHSIVLYNENKKKNIFETVYQKDATWMYKLMNYYLPLASKPMIATSELQSIKGFAIVVTGCRKSLLSTLWHNQILLAIDILIITTLLYFLLKNLLNKRYSLHWAMKKALKNKQFYPVYQPMFNAKTNTFSGAEILLRWQGSNDEIIMPDFFIEEAETTGLIVPITLQIITIALKESKEIIRAKPKFHLSFNICAIHFTDPNFFDEFTELLNEHSIVPQQIVLEITERDLLDENNEIYIKKMQQLREAGFSLAVDDYGTGHASLSYLQYFPFNYLKIDKLFIHAIGTKAITESLNDAIIDLAKKINLIIIAEGVETTEQLDYLLKNGIQLLQGWYFSKAVSIEQLKRLLQGEKK
ncbi:MAG: EAL domain-containing protein [Legionella sp.]|nr:EAL domain-containing protein [Legionella sp.]